MILLKKEKLTTEIEPVDAKDVINKDYLDEKLTKIDGHISFLEKDYNELKFEYNKQSVKEISIERVVKTTIKILYEEGFFDSFANAEEVLKDFMSVTRRGPDLSEQVIDGIQGFCSKIHFEE